MVNKYEVEGFDSFINKVESLKESGNPIFVLFSGSKDPKTGESWCPDCVVAYPIVYSALEKLSSETFNFVYVDVGERSFWKDPNNVFRTDRRTQLKSVPTLLKYGTSQRLEEAQCANSDMVNMLFED